MRQKGRFLRRIRLHEPGYRHREKLYHIGRRTPPVSGIGAERHDSGRPGGLLPEPEHHAGRERQSGKMAECFDFTIQPQAPDAAAADAREQASNAEIISAQDDPNIGRRATYAEYVTDLIQGDERNRADDPGYTPPVRTYAFYDADGNGTDELLIFDDGYICGIVGMKNGVTDEGKVYHLVPCEDRVFIEWDVVEDGIGEDWYHIFRFANNDDPVFSNPKERSIVRLKKDAEGNWWRTSSTDHYAGFDTRITEEEAKAILDSYTPIHLETHPLSEFILFPD